MTPGIRPAGRRRRPEAHHDAGARDRRRRGLSGGGRPITEAAEPKAAADAIQAEIGQAWENKPGQEKRSSKETGSGRVDVRNDDDYKAYAAANPAIFKKFGGRYVVRGGKFTGVEGESRSRNVVIESLTTRRRWPATARRNTRRTSRCGSRMRSPISSSSKAMTARSPQRCRCDLGRRVRNLILPFMTSKIG